MVVLGAPLGAGGKVTRLGHVDLLGRHGQHHGRPMAPAMNAKAVLARIKQAPQIGTIGALQRQVEPVHAVHHQAQALAQVARHHIHQPHMATVRVEQHQALHPAGGHTSAMSVHRRITVSAFRSTSLQRRRVQAVTDVLGGKNRADTLASSRATAAATTASAMALSTCKRQVRAMLLGGPSGSKFHHSLLQVPAGAGLGHLVACQCAQ